jgi:hypothetical protein
MQSRPRSLNEAGSIENNAAAADRKSDGRRQQKD